MTGFFMVAAYSAASSSAVPPISPTIITPSVPASSSNARSASRVVVPRMGSPPTPMYADWPKPALTRLRQINAPRLPLLEITPMRPGRCTLALKAGMMPTKHSPGVTRPAVLGPMTRVPPALAAAISSMTSWAGMCSVSTTSSLAPASMASSAAVRAAIGGTNITATSKPRSFAASAALA